MNDYLGPKFDSLEGSSNLTTWESNLMAYLTRNKAAHRVLKGIDVEPYRLKVTASDARWATVYPEGQTAGDTPPSKEATNFTPQRELTPHERELWDVWANKELCCRSAILLTIPTDIRDAVNHIWSSYDILQEIKSLFQLKPAKRKELILGTLQSMHLVAREPTAMNAYRTKFQTLKNEAATVGAEIPDWMLQTFFMNGLSPDLRNEVKMEARLNPNMTVTQLMTLFQRFTEDVTVDNRTSETAAAAYQRHTEFYVKVPDSTKAGDRARTPLGERTHQDGYQSRPPRRGRGGGNRSQGRRSDRRPRDEYYDAQEDLDDGKENQPPPQQQRKQWRHCAECGLWHPANSPCDPERKGHRQQGGGNQGRSYDRERGRGKPTPFGTSRRADRQQTQHTAAVAYDDDDDDETTVESDDGYYDCNYDTGGWAAHVLPYEHLLTCYDLPVNSFIIDSGATVHICKDLALMTNVRICHPLTLYQAGKDVATARAVGSIVLHNGDTINGVYYLPEARNNLLSHACLDEARWDPALKERRLTSNSGFKYDIVLSNRLYRTELPVTLSTAIAQTITSSEDQMLEWHQKLGHVSYNTLLEAAKQSDVDLDRNVAKQSNFRTDDCVACLKAGARKTPSSGEGAPRGSLDKGLHIHVDLTGLVMHSADQFRFGLIGYIDVINYRFFYGLRSKHAWNVAPLIQAEIERAEAATGMRMVAMTSDGGTEFQGEVATYVHSKGIIHYKTPAESPHLNGVAEANVGALKTRATAMLLDSGLGASYWTFAMSYACVSYNKTTYSAIRRKDGSKQTAWEAMTGRKPNLNNMLPFGTLVIAKMPPGAIKKEWFTEKGRIARILTQDREYHGYVIRYEDDFSTDICPNIVKAPKHMQAIQPHARIPGESAVPAVWNNQPIADPVPLSNWAGKTALAPTNQGAPFLFAREEHSRTPSANPAAAMPGDSRTPADSNTRPAPEQPQQTETPVTHSETSATQAKANPASTAPTNSTTQEPRGGQAPNTQAGTPPSPTRVTVEDAPDQDAPRLAATPPRTTQDATEGTSSKRQAKAATPASPGPQTTAPRRSRRVAAQSAPPPEATNRQPSGRSSSKKAGQPSARELNAMLADEPPNCIAPDHHAAQAACAFAMTPAVDEPRTYHEAMSSHDAQQWSEAVRAELDALNQLRTWRPAKLPKGAKLVGTRWLFKRKRDSDGVVIKYKGRVIAQGWSQRPGRDFENSFTPTAQLASIRLVLTIAAAFNMIIEQGDVSNAFLNSPIDRPVYVKAPEGYRLPDGADCLELLKALYGTKQAGHQWWQTLKKEFNAIGLVACCSDWSIYYMGHGHSYVIVVVYVDDMLVVSRSQRAIDRIFHLLGKKWKITRSPKVEQLLGIRIRRSYGIFKISMPAYIDILAERFTEFPTTEGKYSPLKPGCPSNDDLEPHPNDAQVDRNRYAELTGCLLWIARTARIDVMYAASALARHTNAPTWRLWQMGLRVVAHLVATKGKELHIGGPLKDLEAHSDADLGGSPDGRSTTGIVVTFCGTPISWTSKKQSTVAASTTESEWIAAYEAARDVMWIRNFLEELGIEQCGPTPLHCDNAPVVALAKNPFKHAASKHMHLKYHFLREQVENGVVNMVQVPTATQLADVLTKALPGPQHTNATKQLRIA